MATSGFDDDKRTVLSGYRPIAATSRNSRWLWWSLAGCAMLLCLAVVGGGIVLLLLEGVGGERIARATEVSFDLSMTPTKAAQVGGLSAEPTATEATREPIPTLQPVEATTVPTATPTPTCTAAPNPTSTATPSPTSTAIPSPTATKVWTGGILPVETTNLIINYPDIVDPDEARKHADILQKAYDTYLALFGNEYPFGGEKISIIWDPKLTGGAFAGNPIVVCGRCPLMFSQFPGQVNPPGAGFYHELVHDFTNTGSTQASRYICLNGAMSEAFANYFSCYFEHEVLRYSGENIAAGDKFRAAELHELAQYETQRTDPYSMAWSVTSSPQFYFTGMLFRVSDQCGWGVWQKFFNIALNSGNPGLSSDDVDRYGDMSDSTARKAFADFVSFLSQACGQDLRPMFQNWRFDLQ